MNCIFSNRTRLTHFFFYFFFFHTCLAIPQVFGVPKDILRINTNHHFDAEKETASPPKEPGECLILRSRSGGGMFSVLGDVLALVRGYENKIHKGIKVDFEKGGMYYDKEYGNNWYEYYFEPISYRDGRYNLTDKVILGYPNMVDITERKMTRSEAKMLIDKYIHIKAEIQNDIEKFVNDNFTGNFVICVHYRGTDKVSEAPRVSYETVANNILKVMDIHPDENIKIFIATDEEMFVDFMEEQFGDLICYNEYVLRSNSKTPIHKKMESPYTGGRDALVDCVLLSRGSILIRTSSNLSLWSTFFNPDIPVVNLNKRR